MIRAIAILVVLAIPPAIYFPTVGVMREHRLERAQARLAQLDAQIAETRSPVTAIGQVQALAASIAKENDVRLTRFDVVTPHRANVVEEQSIAAEVVGSAEATAAFLRRIESESRINDVTNVTLTKDPAGWRTAFVMTTFATR